MKSSSFISKFFNRASYQNLKNTLLNKRTNVEETLIGRTNLPITTNLFQDDFNGIEEAELDHMVLEEVKNLNPESSEESESHQNLNKSLLNKGIHFEQTYSKTTLVSRTNIPITTNLFQDDVNFIAQSESVMTRIRSILIFFCFF